MNINPIKNNKDNFEKTNNRIFIDILLLFASAVGVYFNIFNNEYVFDDKSFILGNVLNHESLKNIPQFFTSPNAELYRPIRSIIYALTYFIWNIRTFGYHLNSILFHTACVILIYLISRILFKKENIALFTGLLFAVHPIHTESVTFMTAGFDLVGPIFFFLSLYLYLKQLNSRIEQKYDSNSQFNTIYIFSIASFAIAAFSSEMTLSLPIIVIFLDYLIISGFNIKVFSNRLKYYLPFFMVIGAYILIRFLVLGVAGRAETGHYLGYNKYWTLLTMTRVFVYYIYLLFIPKWNSQPDYEEFFKLSTSFFEFQTFIPALFLLLLVIFAFKYHRKLKTISFIIFWFIITLLPVSNIITMKNIMAERHLYIPSVAVCIFIPVALNNIFVEKQKTAFFLLIILTIIYGGFTLKRNMDWRNEEILWSATLKNFPGSGKALTNLGSYYAKNKQFDKSISYFTKRWKIAPNAPYVTENLHNLANAYAEKKEYDNAIEIYKEILKIDPKDAGALIGVGNVFTKKNDFFNAINFLNNARESNPNNPKIYLQMGSLYLEKGQISLAVENYKKSVEIQPNFDAYYDLGAIFANSGQIEQAILYYQKALEINSNDIQGHIDLGHLYLTKNVYDKAKREFEKVLEIDPNSLEAKRNLEVIKKSLGN